MATLTNSSYITNTCDYTWYTDITNTETSATNSPWTLRINTNQPNSSSLIYNNYPSQVYYPSDLDKLKIKLGQESNITLPDGTVIEIKKDGSFKIIDKDAKVTYKKNPTKEFNKFINASDILEEFVKYLGTIGAKQGDVLNIPLEMFINWIIIEAAKADGEEPPEDVKLLTSKLHTCKCKNCGKFITKQKYNLGINFCNTEDLQKYMVKKRVNL